MDGGCFDENTGRRRVAIEDVLLGFGYGHATDE